MAITDPVLIIDYDVTFTDKDIDGLSKEERRIFWEYMRIYGAREKHYINRKTGERICVNTVKLPGYIIEELTKTKLRSNMRLNADQKAGHKICACL